MTVYSLKLLRTSRDFNQVAKHYELLSIETKKLRFIYSVLVTTSN